MVLVHSTGFKAVYVLHLLVGTLVDWVMKRCVQSHLPNIYVLVGEIIDLY
jgi:hypothetical protein